jgi:hypothetical protein
VPFDVTVSVDPTVALPPIVGAPVEIGATPDTAEVDFENDTAEPALLVAVTRTRKNLVTSAATGVYDDPVLLREISVQPAGRVADAAPELVQRNHLYPYEAVGVAIQVPVDADRSEPYLADPEMAGVLRTAGA